MLGPERELKLALGPAADPAAAPTASMAAMEAAYPVPDHARGLVPENVPTGEETENSTTQPVTADGRPFHGTYVVDPWEPVQVIDPETGLPVEERRWNRPQFLTVGDYLKNLFPRQNYP